MRRISVFGLGYVGAVTAACFAHAGHSVFGVDVNPNKVDSLRSGRPPILEPELDEIVKESVNASRLQATTDACAAVQESEISFICVGTPSLQNGRLDLRSVKHTCHEIGKALQTKKDFHWIVIRSTVLPGTAEDVVIPALEAASGKRAGVDFAVCSNPEFTREGTAVADFIHAPMTVLGAEEASHLTPLRELYEPMSDQIFETSLRVAEMVKYVCNAFHALKVTFANEIGSLCQQLEVDADAVTRIFTSDTKLNISAAYLKPGFPFGGSCLPKDLRALTYSAKQMDLELPLLRAIMPSNQAHLERAVEAVLATQKKRIAILGLSFKAGTDDLRESPSVHLIKRLLGEGRQIRIWDRDVSLGRLVGSNRQYIEEEIPHIGALLSADLNEVISSSELIVVVTKVADLHAALENLGVDQIVLDLRSVLPAPSMVCSRQSQRSFADNQSGVSADLSSVAYQAA